MDAAKKFRDAAAVANRGRKRLGWRYSAELKCLALEHYRLRHRLGDPDAAITDDLGITRSTLLRWLDLSSEEVSAGCFRPVEVIQPAVDEPSSCETPAQLTLITPRGFRIEGITWSQVLELARLER